MAQESGPLVGDNFTDVQWRAILGGEPGIVGDVDGSAYNLTLGAGTDDAQLGSTTQDSIAVVGGFMHRIAEDSTQAVTIPSSTNVVGRTDIIAVRLDSGTYTSAPGPCRLVRIAGVEGSSARPSLDEAPPGVEDFPLWAVTRKGNGTTAEGLNQAAKVDLRRRTGPNLVVPASPEPLPVNVPLGTRAHRSGVDHLRVMNGSSAAWLPTSLVPGSFSVQNRRTGSGSFGSGSMVSLLSASLPSTAPAGVYRVTFALKISGTAAGATVYLRGAAGSSNLTGDEQFEILSAGRDHVFPVEVLFEHSGGAVSLSLAAQISSGTATAPAGSRITASWQGPAA